MSELGDQISDVVIGLLGGGVLVAVANKLFTRKLDYATVNQIKAQTQQIATETASAEVEMIRVVSQEMRESYEKRIKELHDEKTSSVQKVATLEAHLTELKDRVVKLEERERHMLTRASVHEAWDQMAFTILSRLNPDHPPPPPLMLRGTIPEQGHGDK